jgi:gliding-associated putative ABC transporter substrate-binding component GldG
MKKHILTNTIIFVVIIIFLNLVAVSIFGRIDLTKGKVYALSSSSKQVVRSLEDRLVIKAYFSKNLPGEYADTRRLVQDKLSEYQAFSRGRLRFEFIDPSDEEKLKKEAQENGIFPASMRVIENDKLEIREVYMGMAFHYQGRKEALPLIQSTRGLEYDITKTIKKITAAGLKKIAFFPKQEQPQQMPGYPQMPQGNYTNIRRYISENYELIDTDLREEVPIVEALIFTGVQDSLEVVQLYNLDQFIMRGGNVLMFQDRVFADLQTQTAEPIRSNLFDLLEFYGIKIKTNLVADAECGQVNLQQQRGFFRMNTPVSYPFLPLVTKVNSDNMIVKNVDPMQMIFVSEIDTMSSLNYEPLLYSSANSGLISFPRLDIGLEKYMNKNLKAMFSDGPYHLGGIFSGHFSSYFGREADFEGIAETMSSSIILVPDAEFIQDSGAAGMQGNLAFTLNAVDYLAAESDLIKIRSRETQFKPLKDISNSAKKIVRWINILLPSILLILLGILRYQRQLQNRKFLGELYE